MLLSLAARVQAPALLRSLRPAGILRRSYLGSDGIISASATGFDPSEKQVITTRVDLFHH
jgi:hypothetical protein